MSTDVPFFIFSRVSRSISRFARAAELLKKEQKKKRKEKCLWTGYSGLRCKDPFTSPCAIFAVNTELAQVVGQINTMHSGKFMGLRWYRGGSDRLGEKSYLKSYVCVFKNWKSFVGVFQLRGQNWS